MTAPVQQRPVHPADAVAYAFVNQYYMILHQSPELAHKFYRDESMISRPVQGGLLSSTTTMSAINETILSVGYERYQTEMTTVDAQQSYDGGVIVLVTGYLTGINSKRKKFIQSFFLAPQKTGYFVLNDVFRYDEGTVLQPAYDEVTMNHSHDDPSNDESVQGCALLEDVNEETYNTPDSGDAWVEEQEVAVPKGGDEFPDAVTDSSVVEVPKQSYASILKGMKDNVVPLSSAMPSLARSAPKSQVNATTVVTSNVTPESNLAITQDRNTQEDKASSIYVKGLPWDATPALLENEFKKFGPIMQNGIQVVRQRGVCYGFVEFEASSSMQNAIEASPIMINGCSVIVEEKRSTYRGNNRGSFSSGTGGVYRTEGGRGGHGSPEASSSYNHAEFGSRSSGRGGGFSNQRGGRRYWRTNDKTGKQ